MLSIPWKSHVYHSKAHLQAQIPVPLSTLKQTLFMILSLLARNVLSVLLFCLLYNSSTAFEKVSVSPEPSWLYKVNADILKKPDIKSVSSGYYLVLVDHQVNLANSTNYNHIIRHIINESGVQNASEVSVTFSPEFQQVIFHKVNIIREGNIVSTLKAEQIKVVQEETDASDFQYNGLKRAFVLLKDVRKGDRIDLAYSIVGLNPVFGNKYTEKLYFSSSTAISNYFETIIAPKNRQLFMKFFNKASSPIEQLQGDLHIYHWNNPKFKIWQSQPGVPSWFDNYPNVSITEYDNWQQVVNWGLDVFENYQYTLPSDLKNKIAKWRASASDDKDLLVSAAIQFVQDQVRYLGLEIGMYTHKPHSPTEVYQRRFGDCKDKALLLATILQQEGIPAFIALVNTELKEKLLEAVPATDQFDHAIVAIARSKGYIFVDPTVSRQRGELVNLYIKDYGYALIIKKGEYDLQHIDPGFLNQTSIIEKFNVKFADTSCLEVTTTYSGGRADASRSTFADMSAGELEDNYIQYYSKTYDGIQLANELAFNDDSIQNEITVKEAYSIPTLWRTNENGKEAFDIFAKSIYEVIPDPSNALKDAPLALSFPSSTHYTMEINMPEKWVFPFSEMRIKNSSYQFDFVPTLSGSHINLRYYFKTFKDHIPQSEILQYKADYKRILQTLQFELYKNGNITESQSSSGTGVNWITVCFAFVLIAVLALLLKYFNNLRLNNVYTDEPAWPIGGWLILLGVSITASAVVQAISFTSNNYFTYSTWQQLKEAGGSNLQILLVVELTFTMVWLCGSIALLYWFISRRDIFPRMFIGYVVSLLVGQLFLLLLYSFVRYSAEMGNMQASMGGQFARTCIYALVWITYVVRSERVKSTFVR